MAIKEILSYIREDIQSITYLLQKDKQWDGWKTSQEIIFRHGSAPLRILEPLGTGEKETKIPRDCWKDTAIEGVIQPGHKRETSRTLERNIKPFCAEITCKFHQNILDPPSKMSETLRNWKDPQEQSGPPKILSILDTAKNPARENIQGVGIHNL